MTHLRSHEEVGDFVAGCHHLQAENVRKYTGVKRAHPCRTDKCTGMYCHEQPAMEEKKK